MAKESAVTQNYSSVISAINRIASDQIPGGKVKFAIASSRSVTFSETFERPRVANRPSTGSRAGHRQRRRRQNSIYDKIVARKQVVTLFLLLLCRHFL
jgi:hypothetical protein